MKIFIGTSSSYLIYKKVKNKTVIDINRTKNQGKLSKIIKILKAQNHDVFPWWDEGTLNGGEILIDNLIQVANKCDAGIFILRKDDILVNNKDGHEIGVPRDNVLIECGMYLGLKGKERTLVIKDGDYHTIKIASDLGGVLLKDIDDTDLESSLIKFFDNKKLNIESKKTKFYLSNTNTDNILNQEFKKWSSKALYIGSKSARLWEAFENEKDSEKTLLDKEEVKEFVEKIDKSTNITIDYTKINNVISLGPGCGKFDNEIVSKVFSKNNLLKYIPIDINPYYAYKASKYVKKKSPNIKIPFAIIEDFEENSEYVTDLLKNKIHDLKQSCLFLMIGGTFSNLEGDEENVIVKIKSWMDENSYLIVDVFIKPEDYTFAKDDKRQVKELMKSEFYNDFIINSIEKRHVINDEDYLKKVKNNLSTYLIGDEKSKVNTYTNVNLTSVVTYDLKINDSNNKEIFVVKRYDFKQIKKFLEEHFLILESFDGLNEGKQTQLKNGGLYKSERGIFLLQKK
ncbi:MAG: L-histidine N(alpha)-methyltransferase [Limnohabitans sp.]|nr:L-histidine N(alpha)-methyltransferase [Limnohabitans sp.]